MKIIASVSIELKVGDTELLDEAKDHRDRDWETTQ